MYNKFGREEYNKSYAYASRLFSSQIKKIVKEDYHVSSYKDMHTVYNINLITSNYQRVNNDLINIYVNKNKKTNVETNSNIITYLIRLDKLKRIEYNISESLVISILRIINSETLEEVKKYIRKEDQTMLEMEKFLEEWNKNNAQNGFEEYMGEKLYEANYQGKIEGQKDALIKTAKKLVKQNVAIEIIVKATGLTKKEILAL